MGRLCCEHLRVFNVSFYCLFAVFVLCVSKEQHYNLQVPNNIIMDSAVDKHLDNQHRQKGVQNQRLGETDTGRSQKQSETDTGHSQKQSGVITKIKLAEHEDCAEDIKKLGCDSGTRLNNFAVLDCVANQKREDAVSDKCHHLLWEYKLNLTQDNRFLEAVQNVCNNEVKKFEDCNAVPLQQGHFLSCFIQHKEAIDNTQCKQFLLKIEGIIFSDYNLIYKFIDKCELDIGKFKCGRVDVSEKKSSSQTYTLDCLATQLKDLTANCKEQIMSIVELQADDFHFDHALYFACREDRERFCENVIAGDGKVYKCLMHHKMERDMSRKCREQLTRRQKLIVQDYKASKGLVKACKEDIRVYHCRNGHSDHKEFKLAEILLCLEEEERKGSKVNGECMREMREHRRALMEDYHLSPELVADCKEDIQQFCDGLEIGGRTIHCLMEHARPRRKKDGKRRIADKCQRALEDLIKEADVGEDWSVDPTLKEACQPVVDVACQDIRAGEARVLSCLMEKLGSNHMTENCETALLQIQYFVARDFKLDPQLYHHCHKDSVTFCNAKKDNRKGLQDMDPERGPLILPCLYRHAYDPVQSKQLQPRCVQEIRRVMRQRAVSVDLMPEIEEPCLEDLSAMCSAKTGKGEEIMCLQDNFDELAEECRQAVANFTTKEAENIELNPILMTYCRSVMEKHCEDELQKDQDEGNIIQCLIQHKNEGDVRMNYKCRSAVEHFQLISLKDYNFSFKFKEACKTDVVRFCPRVRNKADVVACLSEIVRNDTLSDQKHHIGKECRLQLRSQLFQQRENIRLDPKLHNACREDIKKFCDKRTPGNAQVLECLKDFRKELTRECHRAIFNVEKQQMEDNLVDYTLQTACKKMIRQHCHEETAGEILSCLKTYKDEPMFDNRCKLIVVRRMIEQSTDYRFNPVLRKACHLDIPKFCNHIISNEPGDSELEGKVIACLKAKFREKNRLSNPCEEQIENLMREAALDYRQDPVLIEACDKEIDRLCKEDEPNGGHGKVEECLKVSLQQGKIKTEACRKQVALLIQGAKVDIHVDPLLHRACSLDLKRNCAGIPRGEGQQLSCLLNVLEENETGLERHCSEMLSKRMKMFEYAAKVASVETMGQLYSQVSLSPSRNYFLIIALSLIGAIFVIGMFCGRVTKRVRAELKNK